MDSRCDHALLLPLIPFYTKYCTLPKDELTSHALWQVKFYTWHLGTES